MAVEVLAEPLPGLKVLRAPRFTDARGHFQEVHQQAAYAELGITALFVQDNWSRSAAGTVRGLHYQLTYPQAKLIQVMRGAILDVVVDVRQGSPTYGQWHAEKLSETDPTQVFVPEGFAHGFCTLSDTVDLLYKCSDVYHPEDDRGIRWNDADVNIAWPTEIDNPVLSDKDRALPLLRDVAADQLPVWKNTNP